MRNKTIKCLFQAAALVLFYVSLQAQGKNNLISLPNQITEAKKEGNSKLADSLAKVYMDSYLFKLKDQELYAKENLAFMYKHLSDTEGKPFKLFLKNPEKVNAILGTKDIAQYAIRYSIARAYFKEIDPIKYPNFDWTKLKKEIKSKFGKIGLEALYGKQMTYYQTNGNWDTFGKYYVLYFKTALKRPEYEVNNLTWDGIFEHVNDPEVLKFACEVVMKYAMEEWYQNSIPAYDTYANLLFKIGRKTEAIEWETKALKAAKGTPNEKIFTDVLEKMKQDLLPSSSGK